MESFGYTNENMEKKMTDDEGVIDNNADKEVSLELEPNTKEEDEGENIQATSIEDFLKHSAEKPERRRKKHKSLYVVLLLILIVIGVVVIFVSRENSVSPPAMMSPGYTTEPALSKSDSATVSPSAQKEKVTGGELESAQLMAGTKALKEKRFVEAIALFEEIMVSEPDVADKAADLCSQALQGQASTLVKSEPEKARSLLLKAAQFAPESMPVHFQLGLVNVKLKDYQGAIKNYQKAAEIDPKHADTFFNLGYVFALSKDYPGAERMYGKVVDLAPSYLDEALFNLAMVQKRQGNRKECLESLERALQVNPNNKLVQKHISTLK